MRHLALLVLFATNIAEVLSFCQPGCICFDDGKDVRCDHANLTTFPYMLNPMLKKLSLVDAKLKLLDAASISVYQELEYLDLSNNEIEELPSDFLVGFSKLKEVKLQNNKIRLISDDLFKELPSLEILDLSQNKIERIMADAFIELKSLSSLNLSSNNLHMISPKSFNGLNGLSELDLSNNQFEKLQRETFDLLTGLAYMSLRNNKIKMLPRLIFTEQKKLVKLDFSRNSIESIEEGAFSGLHSLKSLDISYNRLSDISSRNWPYLSELEILDLTKNNFATIYAGFFEGLGSLRSLTISGNEDLQRIELNAFAGLFKLDFIEIRDCPLLNFMDEYAFEHPNQLNSVDFTNNALMNLPINLINWKQLEILELSGNPWKCDCELLRFLPETLLNLKKKTSSSLAKIEFRPICATPEELKGVAIETTNDSNCYTLPKPAMLAVMFGSFMIIIGTLIIAITCLKSKSLCCCSSKDDKEKNLSRAPLYTGGSSFTDSLTYDKSSDMHRQQATLPIYKQQQHQHYQMRSQSQLPHDSGDYYSSIMLLPPPHPSSTVQLSRREYDQHGYGQHMMMPYHHTLPMKYSDDANPYATSAIQTTFQPQNHNQFQQQNQQHPRPPSFIAPPPPPPPSMPPPPLSSNNYKIDPNMPVPSTEL